MFPWPLISPRVRSTLGLALAVAAAPTLVLMPGCAVDTTNRQESQRAIARWEDQRLAPEDSLQAMISDKDGHVRLAAIRAAGLIGRDFAVEPLVAALQDPSVRVRRQACFSLGLLGSPRAAGPLGAVARNPRAKTRLAALQGLGQIPHDGQALLAAAVDSLPEEAAVAWDGLRNQADRVDRQALVAAVRTGLAGHEAQVQWHILRCAELVPDTTLTPLLAPFAEAHHPQVRVHAYRALARQGTLAALKAVLNGAESHRRFKGGHRARVDIALCRALGRLGPVATRAKGPAVEETADEVAAALVGAADSKDPHVVAVAVQAMGDCAANQPLPAEAAWQETLLPPWRIKLARAARAHLQDPHPAVREAALSAWPALRGPACAADLTAALDRETSPQALASALGAVGREHPDPLPILQGYSGCAVGSAGRMPPAPERAALNNGLVRQAALAGMVHVLKERARTLSASGGPVGAAGPSSAADSAGMTEMVAGTLAAGTRDPDFVVASAAAALLGPCPRTDTLAALLDLWGKAAGPGQADIRRGVLAGLQEMLAVETGAAWAPDDSLRAGAVRLLQAAFADPDVRLRVEGRTAALATGLLPQALVPSEASLRVTLPAVRRDPAQPPVALPFDAPDLRCMTDRGTFTIDLDGEIAPNTCAAILDLVARGFYRDMVWHRVVPDFVVQGGDPLSSGWGGPGFALRCEYSDVPYARGTVGIAHDGKDTGGSQFFVTLSEQPHLNGRYTVIGRVTKGMQVVDRLEIGDRFTLEAASAKR